MSSEISQILDEASKGDARAADRLAELVYDELRERARSYLRRERARHSVQATALVHEAYMRLVDQTRVEWKGRTHFFAVAAIAMRRVLVDRARERGAGKRGAWAERITLDEGAAQAEAIDVDVLALHEALERLAALNKRHAKIVELRFFGGLTVEEVAEVMGLSRATIENEWRFARTWLRRELSQGAD
jgi:RNA polymerase sigma factor (TIGR02999 family)